MSKELSANALYMNRTFRDVLVLELTLQLQDVMRGGKGNLEHIIDKLNSTRRGDVIVGNNQRGMTSARVEATGRYDIITAINYMTMAHHGADFNREATLRSLQVSLAKRLVWLAKSDQRMGLFAFDPEVLIASIVFKEAREEPMVA